MIEYSIDKKIEALCNTSYWQTDIKVLDYVREKLKKSFPVQMGREWSASEGWIFGNTSDIYSIEILTVEDITVEDTFFCSVDLSDIIHVWAEAQLSYMENDKTALGNPCIRYQGILIFGGDGI